MPKIKLEPDKTIEAALKYAKGKRYDSTIPGKMGAVMYSLYSGDVIFLEEDICDEPDRMFADAGVGAGVPFALTVRKRNGGRYYELRNLATKQQQPKTTPFDELPSELEAKLGASLVYVEQKRKAQQAAVEAKPAAQPGPSLVIQAQSPEHHPTPSATVTIQCSGLSQLMSGCMVAAIDAAVVGRDYSQTKGLTLSFAHDSIERIAVSLLIHTQRMAELECKYGVKEATINARLTGGASWRQ